MKKDELKSIKWLYEKIRTEKYKVLFLTTDQVLQSVLSIFYVFLFRELIDSALDKKIVFFKKTAILLAVCTIVQVVLRMINWYFNEDCRSSIENRLKSYFLSTLLHKDYQSISSDHSSEWQMKLNSDCVVIADRITEIIPGMSARVVSMFFILLGLLLIDYKAVLLIFPFSIILLLCALYLRKQLKRLNKDVQEKDSSMRGFLQEVFGSILVLKAYEQEDNANDSFQQYAQEHRQARIRKIIYSMIGNGGFSLFMSVLYLVSGIYYSYQLMQGKITYGTLFALIQLVSRIQTPIVSISAYIPHYYALLASTERLMEVETLTDDRLPAEKETDEIYRDLQSFGFDRLNFSYKDITVFEDFSIELFKNKFVAITGPSGIGKSTLMKLLLGLYPLDKQAYLKCKSGTYELDASYRKLFAYVPQDNELMRGTIRDVICFGREYDEQKMDEALRISCCDEFVSQLNNGIGSELEEKGSGLSEGQMQRIAIARAIYSNRPILLLDEVTSSLNEELELKILDNLKKEKDRTVILATHRLNALKYADRIIDFEEKDGKITWKSR